MYDVHCSMYDVLMIKPKDIQQFPSGELGIVWEDSHESIYSGDYLRRNCPCAMCAQGTKQGMGLLHPGRFKLSRIRQVGNYAIGLEWADGHDTGIYAYDYIRKLCICNACKK